LNYLFGKPVSPSKPRADGPRDVFILGVYPSALHVRWQVPGRARPVQAVAVDSEPEPFWTGHDEGCQVERWLREISFRSSWGQVEPCGRLNGSSGVWVDEMILSPLGINRSDAWITDCIDTYFESADAATRLAEPEIVNAIMTNGIPAPNHRAHPSENDIVREAIGVHSNRLRAELVAARPRMVVTLGNAALRVVAELGGAGHIPRKLSPVGELYGKPLEGRIEDLKFEWLPFAHPASPAPYQRAHQKWAAARDATAQQGVAPDGRSPAAPVRRSTP
jgi:uracil-DNA glycosylase